MNAHKWIALLVTLNSAVLFGIAAQSKYDSQSGVQKIVRAETIELVDSRGEVRASISVEPDGEAVFRMRDKTGSIRVKVGASETGSALLLLDETSSPGVHLLARGGKTSITLSDGQREKRTLSP